MPKEAYQVVTHYDGDQPRIWPAQSTRAKAMLIVNMMLDDGCDRVTISRYVVAPGAPTPPYEPQVKAVPK